MREKFDDLLICILIVVSVICSPWSSGRNVTDGWPDSNADSENKDWPNTSQPSPGSAFTDLVAEFEPGKPWKVSFSYQPPPPVFPV